MQNKVTRDLEPGVKRISDIESGTLVELSGTLYIVLIYRTNSANIGAVSLSDGGYLYPDTFVRIVPKGENITLVAGGR
jgi:hypothetical protein